jgi:hypothetical protein
MAIKTIVSDEEYNALPEAIREHYKEDGGDYVLATDGEDRLSEFRANNRTLFRENEDLKKANADQTAVLQSAMEVEQKRTEKDLLSEGKIDELLAQRTEAMRGSYEEKLGEITRAHSEAEKTLDIHIVENQIRDAAIKAQARNDRAVDHIIRAIRPHIQRDGTQAVRIDSSSNVVMSEDGKTPQGIFDLVAEMKLSDSFLFAESSGSGATGGNAAAGATGKQRIRRSEIGKYINEVAAGEVEIIEG